MSDGGATTYQGYQDASSALGEFNVTQFQIKQALAEVRTGMPVRIVRAPYDAGGNPITPGSASSIGYVDVQPMVNQVDGQGGNSTPHGTVYRLSYHRYQGGYGAFVSDPKVGDIGHLAVADRDTSAVRSTNAPANPGSGRRHDPADGTYMGSTQAGPPSQYVAFTEHGFTIHDANGNSITTSGGGPMTISAPNGLVVNGATITAAGEVIDALGKVLGTHEHTGVTSGSDLTGPPA